LFLSLYNNAFVKELSATSSLTRKSRQQLIITTTDKFNIFSDRPYIKLFNRFPVQSMVILPEDGTVVHTVNANNLLDSAGTRVVEM